MKSLLMLLLSASLVLTSPTPTLYDAQGHPLSVELRFHTRDGGLWIQDVNTNGQMYILRKLLVFSSLSWYMLT